MLLNPALFTLPPSEIISCGLQNLTYGSLTKKGLKTMVKTIQSYMDSESIHGFDLGCGDGELIYHLEQELPESTWEGVEISEHRVSQVVRDVRIWQGDFLSENLRPYTVLHADNLCLEDGVAERLESKIALEFEGLYITYRTPVALDFLRASRYLNTVLIETTWTTHPIHFYQVY
jgi:Methionine biosynthesis protein MetW